MEGYIIHYLKTIKDIQELRDKEGVFKDFVNNVESFISYIKAKKRETVVEILQICRRLRDLGAPIEGYKIMKADAEYYLSKGIDRNYWQNPYFAYAFANLGYPTPTIEKELRQKIKDLKRSKFPEFIPLFLNAYGNIFHIYRQDYVVARELYDEALKSIEKIDRKRFVEITNREWDWAYKLIVNSFIDLLLSIERNEKDEKILDRLFEIIKENSESSSYIRLLSRLNQTEIYIARDKIEEAENLVKRMLKDTPKELDRYLMPSANRLRGLIEAKKGNTDEAVKYCLAAFGNSSFFGNTLDEKYAIRSLIKTFRIMAANVPLEEKVAFYKDKGLFDSFLEILRLKDWYLGEEHSQSVSALSFRLADALGFSEKEKGLVKNAGLLHDIGKIMIPWFTLNKTSELDELDWEIVFYHTIEGYRMLNSLGLFKKAEVVRDHHERIDGSGYTTGKKNIPITTEIVAIADAYDASVTPNRRYKKIKSREEAIREIEEGVRGKFSKKLIEALKKVST